VTIKRESVFVKGLSEPQIETAMQLFRESGLELVERQNVIKDGSVQISGYYVSSKRDKADQTALYDRLRAEFPHINWSLPQ
jgi:hypothetical protein